MRIGISPRKNVARRLSVLVRDNLRFVSFDAPHIIDYSGICMCAVVYVPRLFACGFPQPLGMLASRCAPCMPHHILVKLGVSI